VQQGQQGQFQEQLDRIDTQIGNLERQLQRLIDAYQQEAITLQDLSARREQITQRLKGLVQERHNLEQQRDTTIKWEHIANNIAQFRALLGSNIERLSFEIVKRCPAARGKGDRVSGWGSRSAPRVALEEQPVAADQKKKAVQLNFMSCD